MLMKQYKWDINVLSKSLRYGYSYKNISFNLPHYSFYKVGFHTLSMLAYKVLQYLRFHFQSKPFLPLEQTDSVDLDEWDVMYELIWAKNENHMNLKPIQFYFIIPLTNKYISCVNGTRFEFCE